MRIWFCAHYKDHSVCQLTCNSFEDIMKDKRLGEMDFEIVRTLGKL